MATPNLEPLLTVLLRSSLEAGIMIMLVLAAQWLFRKQLSPRWRCSLWLLVVVRMLLIFSFGSSMSVFNLLPHPLESVQPPKFALTTPAETGHFALAFHPAGQPEKAAGNKPLLAQNLSGVSETTSALLPATSFTGHQTRSWATLLFAFWLTGVLVLTGHILISSLRLWRRCARLKPLAQAGALSALADSCERLAVRTRPVLLESMEISSPALMGLFRPRLLLPKGFTTEFSPHELRLVFLHELAHVKRRDLLMNWIMALLQVMHWFNPLVWFGFARWRADRELACDALALEAAGEGQNKEYGRTILRLLESFTPPLATPGLVGILEDKRQLRQRIGLIATHVPARGWPRLTLLLAIVLAVIGLTDPQTHSQTATKAPSFSDGLSSGRGRLTVPTTTTLPEKGNAMINLTNHIARAATIGLLALATLETPALHADDSTAPAPLPDSRLTGAWVLVGKPGHVGQPLTEGARIKIFAGNHWCMIQPEPKTGIILFHHGGLYTLDGTAYHETGQFAGPTTMHYIGETNGHFTVTITGDQFTCIGMGNPWKEVWQRLKPVSSAADSSHANPMIGTWALSSADGRTITQPVSTRKLKICAGGQWCDIDADAATGIITMQQGGTCEFQGNEYSETVAYGDPIVFNRIGHTLKFNLKAEENQLSLTGIKNPWNEVWTREE